MTNDGTGGWGRLALVVAAVLAVMAVAGKAGYAAESVASEAEELEGTWKGEGPAGATASLTLALSPTPGIVATGTIEVASGLVTAGGPFSLIMAGGHFFATPGGRALVDTNGYWYVERLAGGGLSLVRWTRSPSEEGVVTRMQRVAIGKARADGRRTLKVTMGTPFCWDGTERRPQPCGEIDATTWTLTREPDIDPRS
jgi:hypothetical protein